MCVITLSVVLCCCVYKYCWQVNVLEPHPHLPLLATSGLDSDVKLWMPTASEPANMSTLQRASYAIFFHTYILLYTCTICLLLVSYYI